MDGDLDGFVAAYLRTSVDDRKAASNSKVLFTDLTENNNSD